MLLTALKSYLSGNSPPKNLNALSRVILLHGLMSISWDVSFIEPRKALQT